MVPRNTPLVTTIKERCRVCYTCVRECPAKAIRIAGGQAEVLVARCIGCGNCVRVCSQHAKQVLTDIPWVEHLLKSDARVAACIAPSFPAEFVNMDYEFLVGMVRALGFDLVIEVAFGADLVAAAYRRLLGDSGKRRYIATTCPAIVGFVERYHPGLAECLAPIVSPMVATARALRRIHGNDLKVVFIGPCIAKKAEADSITLDGEINAALTFVELETMFRTGGVKPESAVPSDFDPPHAGRGALFSISRGILQAADISEDLIAGDVVAADGRSDFVEALKEFEGGDIDAKLLEVLCCNGCIMGPGISSKAPLFNRRYHVSQYVRRRMARLDQAQWQADMQRCADLDLSMRFVVDDQRIAIPSDEELAPILSRIGKSTHEDELNCGACGYETCREHAIAIYRGLAESEMCLPYTIDQLRKTCGELAVSNDQLASTQEALIQSEKLAHMGQLAAGIAHEVNNPLGTVLMLSHILLDEVPGGSEMREDLAMIVEHADRCKKIVAGLLHFARQNKVELRTSDLRELVRRAVKALQKRDNVVVRVETDKVDTTAEFDRDQFLQVLTNLMNNALAAMPNGGVLNIRTGGDAERVWLAVSDTGVGIPPENRKKIFEPFFTTKQPGQGTGLGLAISYGIVKMHHGDIRVQSNADPAAGPTGTTFTVSLPRRSPAQLAAGTAEPAGTA